MGGRSGPWNAQGATPPFFEFVHGHVLTRVWIGTVGKRQKWFPTGKVESLSHVAPVPLTLRSDVPICGPVTVGLLPFHHGKATAEEPFFWGWQGPPEFWLLCLASFMLYDLVYLKDRVVTRFWHQILAAPHFLSGSVEEWTDVMNLCS